MFFLSDYFNGGCGVVRRLNDKISYQVVTSRYSYISERCILAYKYVGRWENTISVCANVVKFRLKCNRDRRLVLVLMKEDGSNRKVHFLAHLAKGKVSFCHHLASVVRRLSSVNFSYFNLLLWNHLSQMKWSLVGSIYGRSSLKVAHFVPIH